MAGKNITTCQVATRARGRTINPRGSESEIIVERSLSPEGRLARASSFSLSLCGVCFVSLYVYIAARFSLGQIWLLYIILYTDVIVWIYATLELCHCLFFGIKKYQNSLRLLFTHFSTTRWANRRCGDLDEGIWLREYKVPVMMVLESRSWCVLYCCHYERAVCIYA